MAHTQFHDDYFNKLHLLAEHIKAHPEEARAGIAKLSSAAQKPAGELIKIFCSDKTPKQKYDEAQKIRAGLSASVKAEIDNHKTDLAHKIGILTLPEIIERLEKLAEHIKEHPDEARARIGKLSYAAQKPAGDMIKIFVSDKTPQQKFEECRKIRDSLPSDVLGEINAVKEDLAKKIGIVPLHQLGHTHSHDEYIEKLHQLAAHIRAHPEEARLKVSKLSSAAQKPAGEIIRIFAAEGKDVKTKLEDIQKIKAGLPAGVRAEIDNHTTDLAHKIGLLTLNEIIERLDKLAAHIKAHPDDARARVAKLSEAAQKPFGEMIKIFCSDKTPKEKFEECRHIRDSLPSDVLAEINVVKEELAHKIGIVPLHHIGHHTHVRDEYVDRLHRLAEHIKAHLEEARAGIAKLSTAAQQPAGEILKIFVSDKTPKEKYEAVQAVKAGLPASVRAEIDNHKAELAHKIGLLTIEEIIEKLEKLAEFIKAHPDVARARVAKMSTAAQKPFGDMIKIFCSDKTTMQKFEECRHIRDALPSDVLGEINAVKEDIAKKIGIVPLHHLAHTPSHDDYITKLHRLADHIKAHPEEARAKVATLSAAAQQPAGALIRNFCSDKTDQEKIAEAQAIRATLSPEVKAEIDHFKTEIAHKIGILTIAEIVERLEKLADHIKAHPDEARARVAKLSTAAQKPFSEMIKIFCSDKTPKEKFEECRHIRDSLPTEVLAEINVVKEEIATKLGITPIHHLGFAPHHHQDYINKLQELVNHFKTHPDEVCAGVAKLSSGAQKPAGEIVKVIVSDSCVKAKFEEIQKIKAALPSSVRAEIENHITDIAHKVGILTIAEITARYEKLAEHIKEHPDEARAGIKTLSSAAQAPALEILFIFISNKTPRDKVVAIKKVKDALPYDVLGEINARLEQIARRIRVTPLHHLSHTHAHDDYIDKLHRLADHIKAHPEEARAGILKLSAEAQKPAGEILKIFCSDKDDFIKIVEIQKIREGLSAAVKAEIDNHKAELAHKIGILTLQEIVERLEKLAEHIRAHPEVAKAKAATLSPAAQKPFDDLVKVLISNKTPKEKRLECLTIQDKLEPEVYGEILAVKEELSKKLGIAPLHHLGHTHSHDDYFDKLHRLAEHIKAHPEEARAGVAKLSAAAQKPAGEIIKIFVSDKTPREKFDECQKIKAALPAAVRAEIDNHKTDLAHKIGLLTLDEIVERLEKLAAHIRSHPDEARAKVATLSAAAQKPFGEMVKIFVSDKTPKEKFEESRKIRDSLPSDVLGEINAVKEELAQKIGIVPTHHQ